MIKRVIFPSAVNYFIFIVVFLLAGCNVTTDEKKADMGTENLPDYMQALMWVNTANPKVDASKALNQKDYRLYIVASRGERLVGITPNLAADLKERCGTRYIQGSTDVVKDDQHLAMLKKAYAYAEQYNQIIAEQCLK